ncbi:hypothetical protein MRX96_030268 [Rhipicephalus microplus]
MISERLATSPCALVANQFGWTGNMERLARSNAHAKSHDTMRDYYLSQKKNMELNPRHPLIKELLRRVKDDKNDPQARNMAELKIKGSMRNQMKMHLRGIPIDLDKKTDEKTEEEEEPRDEHEEL